MKRLSIKFKVTFWFTLMMVITVAAALAFLIVIGEQTVSEATCLRLNEAVEDSFSEIKYRFGELDIDNDLDYYNDGVYIAVYSVEGELLYGRLPADFDRSTEFVTGEIRKLKGTKQTQYVYDAVHDAGKGYIVIVRGVMPASGSENAFEEIIRLAMIMFPALVIIAALIGYFIAKRAFKPVERIVDSAATINGGNDLSKRIGMSDGKDEIHRLAAEFDKMFDRLEASFENEKRFTSDASHELRTPTAVIISQCEAILENEELDDETRNAICSILSNAEGMAELISSLLTLARADRGHLKLIPEELDLAEAVFAVGELTSELAKEKNIKVEVSCGDSVIINGDRAMITRMLLNICENAVKYGKENGNVSIDLKEENANAVVSISDDGNGIAKESLERIWERFYREDEARGNGTGLGLPLAKYIANAHGGDITVKSEKGVGSLFEIIIPKKL
ncbi:MAG: HAMP domain-containing histidine kinase [Clostridia bacterium]|nr:HAMP domain-containing histidine kinase [Clostridia bacterium]